MFVSHAGFQPLLRVLFVLSTRTAPAKGLDSIRFDSIACLDRGARGESDCERLSCVGFVVSARRAETDQGMRRASSSRRTYWRMHGPASQNTDGVTKREAISFLPFHEKKPAGSFLRTSYHCFSSRIRRSSPPDVLGTTEKKRESTVHPRVYKSSQPS